MSMGTALEELTIKTKIRRLLKEIKQSSWRYKNPGKLIESRDKK